MKKRVLFIMPSLFIGGAERSLLGLLDSFDYSKYEVTLFLYRCEGEFMKYVPEQVDIITEIDQYKTFDVPIKKLLLSNKFMFGIARIISKIAMKIHCIINGEKAGVWMAMQYISKYLQALLPNIPGEYDVGITFLGVPDVLVNKVQAKTKLTWNHTDYTILGPDRKYDRKIYRKIDRIVSVSEQCREQFLKVYPELQKKAVTIENILSVQLISAQANESIDDFEFELGKIHLLSIGRYSDAKNFDNVPFICKAIRDKGLDIKWFIIGYGTDEKLIRRKIMEANMEQYVILLGKKNNPYPYIRQCDLYVQPSRYEGKSVTVREAQILCKPVVITKFATAASQLEDGVDGVIVPMDNEACAEGIYKVLKNPLLMKKLAINCSRKDYSNRVAIEQLYDLF